jgi:hypothetical protein
MNVALKYPQWQEPLAEAILEFDARRLPAKMRRAEEAIANRLRELASENENEQERRMLSDGLSIIRGVKEDRLCSNQTCG